MPAPDDDPRAAGLIAHRVPAVLRPFVAAAHGYIAPPMPGGRHRGLPSRHLTLVVEILGPLGVTGPLDAVRHHGVAGGLTVVPAVIDATTAQEGVQYALRPTAATVLLRASPVEIADRAIALPDLLGRVGDDLVDRVLAAGSWPERFAAVDGALVRLLGGPVGDPAVAVAPEVGEVWRRVFADGGRGRVADLAREVGWSRRHLASRFRAATGLTPKQALRVARFEAVRDSLVTRPGRSLSTVAADHGFADQQHLSREWRALAGCSVGTWLREEFPFVHDAAGDGGPSWPP
jgi:AraC-like DNA-binding protein